MTVLKRVSLRHWAWIHALTVLVAWGVVLELFVPETVYGALQQPLVSIWTTLTILGAITAIIGVLLSVSYKARRRVISVSVELFGMILAAIGPLVYGATQFSLIFTDVATLQHLGPAVFAYFGLAVILYRIAILIPRFRKEAHDLGKII